MLTHVVMMKFKPDVKQADIDELEKTMDELPNTIMEILTYEFGRDVIKSERSFDFALVSNFANPEALERYQNHPEHLKVLEKLKAICENVLTVDFKASDASSAKDEIPDADILDWESISP